MADPNFNVEYRRNDSDNDILRKILANLRGVLSTGTGAIRAILSVGGSDVSTANPLPTSTVVGGSAVSSSNPLPALTPDFAEVVSANAFTRPNDTTQYGIGDLVANSVTAGSVVPVSFANAVRAAGEVSRLERIRIRKTGTSTTNAQFRVHLFSASPTVVNGDNGVFTPSSVAGWIGSLDAVVDRAGSDGAIGAGVPVIGSSITFTIPAGTTLFALLEARAAYTPAAQEQFTLVAELYRF